MEIRQRTLENERRSVERGRRRFDTRLAIIVGILIADIIQFPRPPNTFRMIMKPAALTMVAVYAGGYLLPIVSTAMWDYKDKKEE